MPAYKEKDRNTWTVKIKHKNWSGQIKWVTKRGFATKREALQYERDFLTRQSGNLDMSFADFLQSYREERGARIKESTLSMKDNIIDTKLTPYAHLFPTVQRQMATDLNALQEGGETDVC